MHPDSVFTGTAVLVYLPSLNRPRRLRVGFITGPGGGASVHEACVTWFPDRLLDSKNSMPLERERNMPVYDRFPSSDRWPASPFAVLPSPALAACQTPDGRLVLPTGVEVFAAVCTRPPVPWVPPMNGAEPIDKSAASAPPPLPARDPDAGEDTPEAEEPPQDDPGEPDVPTPTPAQPTLEQKRAGAWHAFLNDPAWDRESGGGNFGCVETPECIEISTKSGTIVARVSWDEGTGYKLTACQGQKGDHGTLRQKARKPGEVRPMVVLAARIGRRCAGLKTRKDAAREIDKVLDEFNKPREAPPVLPGDDPGAPRNVGVALAR